MLLAEIRDLIQSGATMDQRVRERVALELAEHVFVKRSDLCNLRANEGISGVRLDDLELGAKALEKALCALDDSAAEAVRHVEAAIQHLDAAFGNVSS